jgi:hypothetical protein
MCTSCLPLKRLLVLQRRLSHFTADTELGQQAGQYTVRVPTHLLQAITTNCKFSMLEYVFSGHMHDSCEA